MNQTKILGQYLIEAFYLFKLKRGGMLASAASFYFLITIVPTLLLFIRLLGVVLGDPKQIEMGIFSVGQNLFPDIAPEILELIHNIVKRPALGLGNLTSFNTLILLLSSLSFFNAIWNGLFYITDDHSFLGQRKHLKGLFVIAISLLVLLVLFVIPQLVITIVSLLDGHSIPLLKEIERGGLYIFRSNLFYATIFLAYFTFLYRWFFSWKIGLKESLIGATTFVVSLLAGKYLFSLYSFFVKDSFQFNYGSYYTLVIGVIWIYVVMCFFFYGACLCQVQSKKKI